MNGNIEEQSMPSELIKLHTPASRESLTEKSHRIIAEAFGKGKEEVTKETKPEKVEDPSVTAYKAAIAQGLYKKAQGSYKGFIGKKVGKREAERVHKLSVRREATRVGKELMTSDMSRDPERLVEVFERFRDSYIKTEKLMADKAKPKAEESAAA